MTEQEQEPYISFKSFFVPLTTLKAIHFIVIIGLIIFGNGLFNNFVKDDRGQIVENPIVQSIHNLPTFFSGGTFYIGPGFKQAGLFYRPIISTSFSLLYTMFGPNYFAFHLFQLIFYITNACIVFLLFKHFFRKSTAFFLALIFLLHPMNSEVALFISDTQEVLFFFFGITALLLVKNYQSQKVFIMVGFLLLCSLLSKETAVLFIFVTLIYTFIFKRKSIFSLLGYTTLMLGFYTLLRLYASGSLGNTAAVTPIGKLDLFGRFLNMPEIFFFYLKSFFYPLNLAVSHQWVYTQIDFNHFFLPLIIDLVFLSALICFAFILYKKFPLKYFTGFIFFGIWFLLGILLHIQILTLDATVAERWFYFPMVGLLGMIGIFLDVFHLKINSRFGTIIIVIILLLLGYRSYVRTFDWRDNITLSSHDLKVSKEAYDLELELSNEYFKSGNIKEAISHAEKSIKIFPTQSGYNVLGSSYFSLKDYKKAEIAYLKVLTYGGYYGVYDNLAQLALVYGDPNKNIEFIKNTSLKRFPQDYKLWLCLASLDYNYGDKENAKTEIQEAFKYDKGPMVTYAYNQIMNNLPYKLQIK